MGPRFYSIVNLLPRTITVRIASFSGSRVAQKITRGDLSKVLVKCAKEPDFWSKKCVAIGQKRKKVE